MKLDPTKVEWIVRRREKGERNSVVASAMKVSVRRVQEILSEYRRTGVIPPLRRPGRKVVLDTEEERERVRELFERRRENALSLERAMEAESGTHIPHNRIHRMLKEMGFARDEPKKQERRKWVRYEREFSNSLWHADWTLLEGKGWLIAYIDDASRFVTGYGLFPEATSQHSVEVLEGAIAKYGKPASILTDRGIQFYAQEAGDRLRGLTAFEKYLIEHDIRHILSRVNHPQTNGKVERFFGTVKAKMKWFSSVDELMEWYNTVKLHMSLDFEHAETPSEAFVRKLPPAGTVVDEGSGEVYRVDKM
jgi:putative transposase